MTTSASRENLPLNNSERQKLPAWFRINLGLHGQYRKVHQQVVERKLHTVCQSARCPNRNECWNAGTATFMILGDLCTRNCRFCGVRKGIPGKPDPSEPNRVAEAVAALSLKYVVITSVTRDDLEDGGAGIFAATIREIRRRSPFCRIEVLIPDFGGSERALDTVIDACPDVLGHNVETVPSLYLTVRPQAEYVRSLKLLERVRKKGTVTKSGIMVGLGERREEISGLFRDLKIAGCEILTIGQYLQPGRSYLPVQKLYHPEEFAALKQEAEALGFLSIAAGPLVRSSYNAGIHHAAAKPVLTGSGKVR